MTLGAIVTPLLVVAMVGPSGEGWRTLFMVVGAAGSLWVAAWLASTRGEPAREMARPPPEEGPSAGTPLWSVFFARQFWITAAVGIAVNICWHFYRVWLPLLMKDDMKINPKTIQYLIAGFYLVADIGSIATGYAISRLTRRGWPLERVRKIVLFWTAGLSLLGTFVLLSPGTMVMVPLIFLVGAGIMGVFAIFYSLVQDICPAHTSKCLGLIGSGAWFINAYLHVRVGRLADHIQTPFGKFAPVLIAVGFLPLLVAFLALAWPRAPSSRGSYS
jgi:ACS family hexuronate transporter-like MFS transporter